MSLAKPSIVRSILLLLTAHCPWPFTVVDGYQVCLSQADERKHTYNLEGLRKRKRTYGEFRLWKSVYGVEVGSKSWYQTTGGLFQRHIELRCGGGGVMLIQAGSPACRTCIILLHMFFSDFGTLRFLKNREWCNRSNQGMHVAASWWLMDWISNDLSH